MIGASTDIVEVWDQVTVQRAIKLHNSLLNKSMWSERTLKLGAYTAAKDFLDLANFTSLWREKMTSLVTPPLFGL